MTPGAAKLAAWRADPWLFIQENFHPDEDPWQIEAAGLCAGRGIHRVVLEACVGPGKSAFGAMISWWFLSLHSDGVDFPKGALLSNSSDNLTANLWAEMSKWRSRSEFLKSQFEINTERIFRSSPDKDIRAQWFLDARSYPQKATPEEIGEVLSGLHAKWVLIVLDESGGTPPIMLKRAAQAMATVEYGLILVMGNTTSKEGALYAADQDTDFMKIHITGDPDDPKCSNRVNKEENRKSIKKWGYDDPWVCAHVLGRFPESSLNSLLSEEQVRAALGKHLKPWEWTWSQRRIGIDVAGSGIDRTVMAPRQGRAAFPMVVMRTQDGPEIAARYAVAKARFSPEITTIDGTGGWANSVVDFAKQAQNTILPVNFASKPTREGFVNRRAEMYWDAAQWVKDGGALPNDDELVKEATCSQYFFKGDRIQIEDKEQVKRRLGFSPDKWDAFVLTFAVPELASADRMAQVMAMQAHQGRAMLADLSEVPGGIGDNLGGKKPVDMFVERNDDSMGSGFSI